MLLIFILLVVYQIKHFIADFPLQNSYMLKKFLPGKAWILPLMAHAGVHAVFTLIIATLVLSNENRFYALPIALLDFTLHFVMDRLKASPELLGKYKGLSGDEYKFYVMQKEVFQKNLDKKLGEAYKKGVEEIDKKFKGNTYFWWALGLDQMVHHLTHYILIYLMLQGA